jgi:hypothetical protein
MLKVFALVLAVLIGLSIDRHSYGAAAGLAVVYLGYLTDWITRHLSVRPCKVESTPQQDRGERK